MLAGSRQLMFAKASRSLMGAAYRKPQSYFSPAVRGFHATGVDLAKVLLCDGINPAAVQVFEEAGHSIVERPKTDEAELKQMIGEFDAIVVRSATKVTEELLKEGQQLRLIGRAGAGTDNIDKQAATRRGILVMNTPGGNTRSAAELAMSLLFSLVREMPQAMDSLKAGKWERKKFSGTELKGKQIGVIGTGAIGREVCRWCNVFGMKVVGYDPNITREQAEELGIELANSLDDLYSTSDIISVHVPGDGTKGMIGEKEMDQMKKGVLLVNAARGGVIDEQALYKKLEEGHVGGAALDVFTQEPPEDGLRNLINHPKVVCTPHLGASTEEAQIKVAMDIAKQMVDAFDGKRYYGVVNAPHVALAQTKQAKPFVALSKQLGTLVGQLMEGMGPVKSITAQIKSDNKVSNDMKHLLSCSTLEGMLPVIRQDIAESSVNLISAPFLAEEKGIKIESSQMTPWDDTFDNTALADYRTLLRVVAKDENGKYRSATGTLLDDNQPRIVQIDEWSSFPTFSPKGHLILFNNIDRPGAVSNVARVLAEHNINVANMGISRQAVGSPALCILTTDEPIPRSVKLRLSELEGISNLSTARFEDKLNV